MDRYTARINCHGTSQRERIVNRLISNINNKTQDNPSYKEVKHNGNDCCLMINSGSKPYYKEFQGLCGQNILAGDYIEWANSIWLVYEADNDDEIYIDGTLRQCQYKLYWQKTDGSIVSRYAWVQNASAYNNGESGNNTITLQSNQFMVYMPYDDDTEELDNGLRIHMSRSNLKCKPYTLTRPDDLTYGYGKKGILNIIFTQTQYNDQTDKLVTLEDGSQVWICDCLSPSPALQLSPEQSDRLPSITAVIEGNDKMRVGFPRTYTVSFFDPLGNKVPWDSFAFSWNINSELNVLHDSNGDSVKLLIEDGEYVGKEFDLEIIMNGVVMDKKTVNIISVYDH